MYLCKIIHNLVETHSSKISKLHFHHAFKSFKAQAKRSAYDRTFAQGRIANPPLSELLNKSFGDLKSSAVFRDVLPH